MWSLLFIRVHGPWSVLPPLPPSVSFLEPSGAACHCRLLACGLHVWEQTGHRLAQLRLLHHGLGTWPPTPHCAAGQVVREGPGERAGSAAGSLVPFTLVVPSHCVLPALGSPSCALSLSLLGLMSLVAQAVPDCHTIAASCQVPGQARPACLPSVSITPAMVHCTS